MAGQPARYQSYAKAVTDHVNGLRTTFNDWITGGWKYAAGSIEQKLLGLAVPLYSSLLRSIGTNRRTITRMWAITSWGVANLSYYTGQAMARTRTELGYVRYRIIPRLSRTMLEAIFTVEKEADRKIWLLHKYVMGQLRKAVTGLEHWVNRQASANGYDKTLKGAAGNLKGVLSFAASHEHLDTAIVDLLVNRLVTVEATGATGGLDALFQSGLNWVLHHVVDQAVNKLLGDAITTLARVSGVSTLAGVESSIGDRLNDLEAFRGRMTPLEAEASALGEMGTLAFDAALVAWFGEAITHPERWARDTLDVIGPPLDVAMTALKDILNLPHP